jgi:hypothetical protein
VSATVDWLRKLREAGLTEAQAAAIASVPDERYVTRDYLDARLEAFEHRLTDALTVRMVGIAGLVVVLVGLLYKFVRP